MHIPRQESRGHVSNTKVYFIVGGLLFLLTAITVGASMVDWGTYIGGGILVNVLIAVAIATVKALLVMMYFMHMKYENKLVWGYGIIYPLVIFSILITMSVIDVFNRVIPEVVR